MEAYVVPEISSIPNTHVELVKSDYPHLKRLWFSDVSMGRDEMVIDVLVGADYLWHFQKGCTIRGNFDEPVAVETELGWVLSGPMKGQDTCSGAHFTQVNFIASSVEEQESLEDVRRLWDLETLGIREITDQVMSHLRITSHSMGPGTQLAYLGRRDTQNYPLTMEPVCIG